MGDPHVIKKRGKQEEEDFKILFRGYFASMCVFANRYLEDGEMARDVVHDVFCRLWENPSELVGVANVKNYLYTSVKNRCLDVLRRENIHHRYVEWEQENEKEREEFFEIETLREDVYRLLDQAIQLLPERTREILLLNLQLLKNQEIKVIFSVDMFNEGVDIASLDMVMFLRPTESPTVFLQQLGRGLRISKGKEYVNVLDFIGNYEKAGRAPFLLNGGACVGERTAYDYSEIEYPDDCIVDFDMRLIDLFREMDKKSLSIKERIQQEYYRVKELFDGKSPTRMELFTNMDDHIYEYCMKHSKENPFKRYMDFLYEIHELSDEELLVYNGIGKEFLQLIETTDMQKVYKMPILYSFYNDGNVRMAVTEDEVVESRKRYVEY